MKLTKEEVENYLQVIEDNAWWLGNRQDGHLIIPQNILSIKEGHISKAREAILSHTDHLEERVGAEQDWKELFSKDNKALQSQLDQLGAEKDEATKYVDEEIVKAAGLDEAVKVLRYEYDQLREECKVLIPYLTDIDKDEYAISVKVGHIKPIAELVKGGK